MRKKKRGLHTNRTFGGDRRYCPVDGYIDTSIKSGEGTGKGRYLSVEPAPMGRHLPDVHR